MKFSRVLILADNNQASRNVVQTGYGWASGTDAKVFLAHIIDEALVTGDVDDGIFPDEALRRMRVMTEKQLNNFKDDYSRGIATEILTPVGEIRKVIPELIDKTGAELIITGAHSHNLFERLIEGDVDESVLQASTVPVLVLPLKKMGRVN
jgi:nucleotide-binding universal stress UspA family protein